MGPGYVIRSGRIVRLAAPLAILAALALAARPAAAQSAERGYLGAGLALVSDRAPRLVLGGIEEGERSHGLLVDAGVFVAPRLALGVEVLRPAAIRSETSGRFGRIARTERELAVTGLVRVVAARGRRGAVHAVGGIGAMRGDTETHSLFNNDPLPPVRRAASTTRTFAVPVAGADALVHVTGHVGIGLVARLYWLRGDAPEDLLPGTTPAVLERSSTRVVFAVVGRAGW